MKNIDIIKALPNHKFIEVIDNNLKSMVSEQDIKKINEFLMIENPYYEEDQSEEFYIDRDIHRLTLNSNIKELLKKEEVTSITITKNNNLYRISFTTK